MNNIKNKPLILVTNDDGVRAKGINELIKHIADLGRIVVVAPEYPQSGMSSAITSINPLRVKLLSDNENLKIYSCSGTPVDCVKLGVNELLERKPDIVVSGINHGSNAGISVIYSGTMGAAIEGCIFGIPSVGLSLTDHDYDADFSEALKYCRMVVENVIKHSLPKGVCLNLNVPNIDNVKGLKVCSQTKGKWTQEFQPSKDPSGKTIYWLTGEFDNEDKDNKENDDWALDNGYAALVPVQIDMTAYHFMESLKEWEVNL
ncbi:5'-nucleotidase [Dysgonomonadaceae bacterium PH5-43]|nr:5'-nucleotidase [Dysgonomonadaceae bacterium PH5-43]